MTDDLDCHRIVEDSRKIPKLVNSASHGDTLRGSAGSVFDHCSRNRIKLFARKNWLSVSRVAPAL